MIRNRALTKIVAVFFVLEIIVNTITPAVTLALTSGPTAPEVTSFEPVDTTDIVNPLTGDLAYNIPLLEVPGPSGGYPLSLSYHAGTMPNEEASWTGLGWTLNPGAIDRSVNGFADDLWDVAGTNRYFWEGGETVTRSIGVNVSLFKALSASAGLSFSKDTYQGFGLGSYVGVMIGFNGGASKVGLEATVGKNPYGGGYASAGVVVGVGSGAKISAGLTTDFKSLDAQVGIKATALSTDASISTRNHGTLSLNSPMGRFSTENSNSNRLSSTTEDIIPPLGFVNLSTSYYRYWIDEIKSSSINGSLYNWKPAFGGFDNRAYDSYSLLDPNENLVENDDADKVLGGSFLAYDNYAVNAQGLNGNIRPYAYKELIFRQNKKTGNEYQVKQYNYTETADSSPIEFRFIGDFSNKYLNSAGTITPGSSDPFATALGVAEKTGEHDNDGIENNHLAGSRHIEWYTNAQILGQIPGKTPFEDGLMECKASGFLRSSDNGKNNQIGAFKITNESGVTYHFALPAYTYSEYQYSENIHKEEGLKYNELKKENPYAYTWYLTAITGTDYVDRGPAGDPDGKLNEYDWGYWVEFEYGKWSDMYYWRNPGEGYIDDIDNNFQNFSEGRREVYYLDAIRTKTHTAIFFKDIRNDGKSTIYAPRDRNALAYSDLPGVGYDKINIVDATREGGYTPRTITNNYKHTITKFFESQNEEEKEIDQAISTYIPKPTSSLKLSSILLIENEKLKSIPLSKEFGEEYAQESQLTWQVLSNEIPNQQSLEIFTNRTYIHHFYSNVFDIHDFDEVKTSLQQACSKGINLISDYSLAPETSNSFDSNLLQATPTQTNSAYYPRQGKLTLNEIEYWGHGGVKNLVPSIKFGYDLASPEKGTSFLTSNTEGKFVFADANSNLETGSLIKFSSDSKVCYALVAAKENHSHILKIVGANEPVQGIISWTETKNPPYNKKLVDLWGFYKSDFVEMPTRNLSKLVSVNSAKSVDVWSLRNIKTSLGSTIEFEYESDTYTKPVLYKANLLQIANIVPLNEAGSLKITFHNPIEDLRNYMDVNSPLGLVGIINYWFKTDGSNTPSCDGELLGIPWGLDFRAVKYDQNQLTITQVNEHDLVINSGDLYNKMTKAYGIYSIPAIRPYPKVDASVPCYNNSGQEINLNVSYETPPEWRGGNLSFGSKGGSYSGGGLRVSEVRLNNITEVKITNYQYQNGHTSYEPFGLDNYTLKNVQAINSNGTWNAQVTRKENAEKIFFNDLYGNFHRILAISREVPPPGILYQLVKVQDGIIKNGVHSLFPNYSTYEFEVFDEKDIDIVTLSESNTSIPETEYDGIHYETVRTRDLAIKSLASSIGQLKKISLFAANGVKLHETTNHYLHDDLVDGNFSDKIADYETKLDRFGNQGVIQETLIDARFAKQANDKYDLIGVVSRRHHYPSIKIGQSSIDYKTGVKTSSKNLAFDFYSGEVTHSMMTDGYDNSYVTELVPAYREYDPMGLAIHGGKNMLIQQASSSVSKINSYDESTPISLQNPNRVGLVTASVQTWSGEVPIYRNQHLQTNIQVQIEPKSSDGLYYATDLAQSVKVYVGDQVKFNWNGTTFFARIMNANRTPTWKYGLDVIANEPLIGTTSNVTLKPITVYRKKSNISFVGDNTIAMNADGLYPIQNNQLPNFAEWHSNVVPEGWKRNSQVTSYDLNSNILELKDANNDYSATKMSSDQNRVLATAAFAQYNEFAYSGAEDILLEDGSFGGGVEKGQDIVIVPSSDPAQVHTGLKALQVSNSDKKAFRYTFASSADRAYRVSVWANSNAGRLYYKVGSSAAVPSNIPTENKKAGSWYLIEIDIPKSTESSSVEVWCSVEGSTTTNFDDFRVCPIDASMISYVYNQWGELSHILNSNNLYTEYKYDELGRLIETYYERFNKVEEGLVLGRYKMAETKYRYYNQN